MNAPVPFAEFLSALDGFPASVLCIAEAVSEGGFDGEWRVLALRCRDRAEWTLCRDPVVYDEWQPKDRTRSTPAASTSTAKGRVRFSDRDDWLLDVPPVEYVQVLAGIEVGRDHKVPCPFHDDTDPSLHVYDDPDRGWFCFGCQRGGDIFNFAAELAGVDHRTEFPALHDYLEGKFS